MARAARCQHLPQPAVENQVVQHPVQRGYRTGIHETVVVHLGGIVEFLSGSVLAEMMLRRRASLLPKGLTCRGLGEGKLSCATK